jgi:spore maturation protein CgeB
MKIIYVGTLANKPDRDTQWIEALASLGLEIYSFGTNKYFSNHLSIFARIKKRLNTGEEVNLINKDLLDFVDVIKPVWIHFRMPIEFRPSTLKILQSKGIYLSCYFNDDPFSVNKVRFYYRLFYKTISYFNVHYVYRKKNIDEFIKAGAKKVIHCPPAYVPWRHFKNELSNRLNFTSEAVFIGHWENDNRVSYLEYLYNNNIDVKIFGGMWPHYLEKSVLKPLLPIIGVYGEEYNNTYASTLCGLCFFSKINNDQWTERPLEIIAVGGLLVCEKTSEAELLFKDREEAFFFSSKEELLSIVLELRNNLGLRNKVLSAGYKKLISSNSSILDRVKLMYNNFLSSK